jgi:hypothetical protein
MDCSKLIAGNSTNPENQSFAKGQVYFLPSNNQVMMKQLTKAKQPNQDQLQTDPTP